MTSVVTVQDLLGELEGMMDSEVIVIIKGQEYKIREVIGLTGSQVAFLCRKKDEP